MIGGKVTSSMMDMPGSMNINFTKEQLLDINARLNKIKTPKKQYETKLLPQTAGAVCVSE